jgi:tetratricopeptide (TPR) repeat protein
MPARQDFAEVKMLKKTAPLILAASIALLAACSQTPAKSASRSEAAAGNAPSSSAASSGGAPSAASSSKAASSASAAVHESSDPEVVRLYTEASKYYTSKDYTNAVKKCDAALSIDPLCYEAINIKGAARYYATGDPQQGLPLINKCIELNPGYQYGYFNKALIYKGEKNWDMSIGLFNKVIELAPDNAWAYYGISTIYADRNMVDLSLQYLKKAIEVDPSVKETAKVQSHYDRMRSNKDFQALVK